MKIIFAHPVDLERIRVRFIFEGRQFKDKVKMYTRLLYLMNAVLCIIFCVVTFYFLCTNSILF